MITATQAHVPLTCPTAAIPRTSLGVRQPNALRLRRSSTFVCPPAGRLPLQRSDSPEHLVLFAPLPGVMPAVPSTRFVNG